MLYIDKKYYFELIQEPRPKNKAKLYEENIGKTHLNIPFLPMVQSKYIL